MDIPLKGRLQDCSLPKVLIAIQRGRKTGVLTLKKAPLEKKIYFKKGDAIFASSNYEDDRLGEMLLKAGKITIDQYDRSVAILKKTGKRQGGILVELGYLSPKDLFWGVKYQVREIIYSLFLLEDGEYSFIESDLPTEEVITLRMSIANLIYEGVKRIDNWTRIKRETPPLDTVLQLSHAPANLFQDIELAEEDRKILLLIDGKRTIKEIFDSSGMDNFKTLKAIYVLTTIGMATIKVKEVEEPVVAEILQEVLSEKPKAKKEAPLTEKIHKFFRGIEDMNHYQVLGVEPGAPLSAIKKGYYRLSKEYHPDMHLRSPEEGLKDELTAIFDRINKAYEVLADEGKRAEYDLSLSIAKLPREKRREEEIDQKRAEEQFKKGVEEFKKGNYLRASESFTSATKLNPQNTLYWSHLALSLAQIPKRLHDAEEACKKAIELEPTNDEHYSNLGLLYLKAGLKKKAEAQFKEALRFNPKSKKAMKALKELQK
jgi:curved DNA-binding protein CbpA